MTFVNGSGSYSIKSIDAEIAFGGQFGYTEVKNFNVNDYVSLTTLAPACLFYNPPCILYFKS